MDKTTKHRKHRSDIERAKELRNFHAVQHPKSVPESARKEFKRVPKY